MKVAVLGCGPAGLLAAHAARLMGHEINIFSDKKEPSRIGGAQFLHRHIQGITDLKADGLVDFMFKGRKSGYALKIYGDENAPTSWDSYKEGLHEVWNMQKAYDQLWGLYQGAIYEEEVDKGWVYMHDEYEVILSCIPAPVLCDHTGEFQERGGGTTTYKTCDFTGQPVWISEEPDFLGSEMQIIYNGYESIPWYRWSSLFGHSFLEFASKPAERPSVRVNKPLSTTCPGPNRPGVYRLGRYGAWEKTRLIHHAFEGALEVLR